MQIIAKHAMKIIDMKRLVDKTSQSPHYSKEQLLNIRRVMWEVRSFKIMPPETIRGVHRYKLIKSGKRSGKKKKSGKKIN